MTAVPKKERHAFVLSAPAWRNLKDIALRTLSGHATTLLASDAKPLVKRGLLEHGEQRYVVVLTDLGKRVYSRLSVGPFCDVCGRPVAFLRRVARPGGTYECLSCAGPS